MYFFDLGVLDEPISHEDFLQKGNVQPFDNLVRDLAEIHGERLGPRATLWLEVALSRLVSIEFSGTGYLYLINTVLRVLEEE